MSDDPSSSPGEHESTLLGNADERRESGPSVEIDATVPRAEQVGGHGPPGVAKGTTIGDFVVVGELGRGATGMVLAAFDPVLERKVAIKLLSEDLAGAASSTDRQRLINEARAMARLSHPNIVAIHEVGTWNNRVFIVMEHVVGITLRRWLETGPLFAAIVDVYCQAARGLAAAHRAGMVHRDFKPDNVMIGSDGRVRVADFGLALGQAPQQPFDEIESNSMSQSFAPDQPNLTATGALVGTPAYMSPEQYDGKPLDGRSDQFSFCVALYEALCGQRPFAGKSLVELSSQVRSGIGRLPKHRPPVPVRVRRLLERGLRSVPQQRYPSMEALVRDLESSLPRSRKWALVAALMLMGGSVVGGLLYPRKDVCAGGDEQVVALWSAPTKESIRQVFVASGRGSGTELFGTFDAAMNEYVDSWVAHRRKACVAALVEHRESDTLFDLKMRCLARRADVLSALVEGVGEGGEAVLNSAAKAVRALPDAAECADSEWVTAEVPMPESHELALRISSVRKVLSEVEAQYALGHGDAARELLNTIFDEAVDSGYDPIVAEANWWDGRLAVRSGDYALGEAALRKALAAAARGRATRLELDTSITLAYVVGALQRRYDEGLGLCEITKNAISRSRAGDVELARLESNVGLILAEAGRYQVAIDHAKAAVELISKARGERTMGAARMLTNLGSVLTLAGQYRDAEPVLRRAIALKQELIGREHPEVIGALGDLGTAQMATDLQGALRTFDEALTLATAVFPQRHPRLIAMYSMRSQARAMAGMMTGALEDQRKAVALARDVLGPKHPTLAESLVILTSVLLDVEQVDEAAASIDEAATIAAAVWPSDHPRHSSVHYERGRVRLARHDIAGALQDFTKTVELRRADLPPDHPDLGLALAQLGEVESIGGDVASARAHLREALGIYEKLDPPDAAALREIGEALAKVEDRR